MKRRNFFQIAGATTVAMTLPKIALAQSTQKQVFVDGAISFNHGHELSLSIADVVELFARTKGGVTQEIDIQGASGHPHRLVLDQGMLIDLLQNQELEVESTEDAGHSHAVVITLEILEA